MIADVHPRQTERLRALHAFHVLDTPREADFDEIVALASAICEAPISVVNLIDADRQWFKAEVGLGVRETPLATSICSHAILQEDFLEVPDTRADPRMCDNPLCLDEPGLRFYAGAILKTEDGLPIGTLCILDHVPRELTPLQRMALRTLANQVMTQLRLRRALRQQSILRQEIDHRVKNSLAMIASLLHMQKAKALHRETIDELGNVERRLAAIGALHEEIVRSSDGDRVDVQALLQNLARLLQRSAPPGVTVSARVDPVEMDANQASAVAMLVNEFVANSFKYAFPDGQAGAIGLEGRLSTSHYRLSLHDDGVGDQRLAQTPSGVSQPRGTGLGLRVIQASVAQLRGVSRFGDGRHGTRLDIDVPLAG